MKRVISTLVLAATIGLAASAASAQVLNSVKQRGILNCGANGNLAGFSLPDAQGNWTGLDADFCRALAAAIFDDPKKVKFVPLSAKDRFTANLGYTSDKFDINFTGTYIGKSFEDDQLLTDPSYGLTADAVSVPAEFYLDVQATFRPAESFELYVGADNVLDNAAPNILSGSSFNTTGADTAADVYDVFGRRFYAGVRLKF